MTTKDAIKLLPLDDTLKRQVLNMYDFMEPDAKRTIERLSWKTYFYMYNQQTQFNIINQFEEVEQGKAKFGKEFAKEVDKKTQQDMRTQADETAGSVDLAAARHAMEQIMNEIRSTRNEKKASKKAVS